MVVQFLKIGFRPAQPSPQIRGSASRSFGQIPFFSGGIFCSPLPVGRCASKLQTMHTYRCFLECGSGFSIATFQMELPSPRYGRPNPENRLPRMHQIGKESIVSDGGSEADLGGKSMVLGRQTDLRGQPAIGIIRTYQLKTFLTTRKRCKLMRAV